MKALVNRTFKSYSLLLPQKLKKSRHALYEIFFMPSRSVQRYLNPLFQSKRHNLLLLSLLQRISQPPGSDRQINKRTQCRLPPQSFMINLRDTSSSISINSLGLYLSAEDFKFIVFRFLGNAYCIQTFLSLSVQDATSNFLSRALGLARIRSMLTAVLIVTSQSFLWSQSLLIVIYGTKYSRVD